VSTEELLAILLALLGLSGDPTVGDPTDVDRTKGPIGG
jgi:hypothetical protein